MPLAHRLRTEHPAAHERATIYRRRANLSRSRRLRDNGAFSGFCILYGYNTTFSKTMLKSLYKNHGQYVALVRRESNRLVREGFWLKPDAQAVIRQAARADVP